MGYGHFTGIVLLDDLGTCNHHTDTLGFQEQPLLKHLTSAWICEFHTHGEPCRKQEKLFYLHNHTLVVLSFVRCLYLSTGDSSTLVNVYTCR